MGGRARSTPLTVVLPVRRSWALWLRAMWARSRVMRRLTGRPPLGSLALASIGFAHWALLERMPANAPGGRRLPYSYLVFQSNFAGTRDAYIETFCFVIPWIMRGLWTGIYGTPSVRPVGRFQRYVEEADIPPAHYWSAYPEASTAMILAALRAHGDTPVPGTPEGFCSVVPIRAGRLGSVVAELTALPDGAGSPFARVPGTHFGRFVVVPSLADKHGHAIGPDAHLLVATEFDGPLDDHLDRLEVLADLGVWRHCEGAGGDLRASLLAHRVRPGYSFAGYPEATVERVREVLS